ncbi:VanW family protein [Paenibacillus sp. YPG26]|uniref:VanW family protein n=1 Tax=Paenibacillus sp. YPG26 TaxID=2878915 RepID=UPI00203DCCA0|nr:VanW family protein [Paenibacillus sp. YPG26]USB32809.1 VanW family protein [Paenibacillus sp. YPG26]
MKKLHVLLIVLASLLLLAAVSFGLLQLYASRTTVPSGVQVGGIEIGGLPLHTARIRMEKELSRMENAPVVFSIPASGTSPPLIVQANWRQAGVHYTAKEWLNAAQQLTQGSIWSRASARWRLAKRWSLSVHWDKTRLRRTFSPSWEVRQFGESLNAKRIIGSDDSISYEPGQPVTRIDWAEFENTFRQSIPASIHRDMMDLPTRIPVALRPANPAVTLDTLRSQGIQRKISEFSTSLLSSKAGRLHNIEAAAKVIDDMLLAPGEIFDYAKVIDKAEHEYGFKPAPVIVQGKLVPGIGGGICQVSSTLYNAAIRAGLGIVERRNHSLPVSYLPKGQDATFAKGFINFRFKNTTTHYILIKAALNMDNLSIKLFGDIPDNVSYRLDSRTVKLLPIPQKFVKNNTLALGEQQVIQQGKMGYIVETYRIKYVDGEIAETRKISRDTYHPQPAVIAINMPDQSRAPSEPEGSQAPLIEDGVQGPIFSGP